MDIKIILFEKQDASSLSEMIYRVIDQLEKENPELDYSLVRQEDAPEELIKASTEGKIWIAKDSDNIVGTLSLFGNHLRRFFVHPDHQGKGIGRKLLEIAEKTAKQDKYKEIVVGSILRAVPIYKKMGFTEGKVYFEELIGQHEMEMTLRLGK